MTIAEAIEYINTMKPNDYTAYEKTNWLYTVDMFVLQQIYNNYVNSDVTDIPKYDFNEAETTELLIPHPYAEDIYFNFMAAKIDLYNREIGSYNNNILLYNSAIQSFKDFYNKTHTHKQTKHKYF